METVLAILAGALVAGGVYLMLGRSLIRYLFGLVFLGNAANLAIFAAGRVTRGEPALVPPGAKEPLEPVAAALPQALILTAIVISFGLLAFAFVLATRAYAQLGTVDSDAMRVAEAPDEEDHSEAGDETAPTVGGEGRR